MDQKVSKESFKAYRDWQRYILKSKPKLSAGIRRVTLIAYCLAMASHGANGQRCFASDPTLAEEIGLNEAKRVAPYRHEAIRLGWFALTGEHKGRVKVISIAVPEDGQTAAQEHFVSVNKMVAEDDEVPAGQAKSENISRFTEDDDKPAEPPEHDAWIDAENDKLDDCPACVPLLGSHSLDELRAIHMEAVLLSASDA